MKQVRHICGACQNDSRAHIRILTLPLRIFLGLALQILLVQVMYHSSTFLSCLYGFLVFVCKQIKLSKQTKLSSGSKGTLNVCFKVETVCRIRESFHCRYSKERSLNIMVDGGTKFMRGICAYDWQLQQKARGGQGRYNNMMV